MLTLTRIYASSRASSRNGVPGPLNPLSAREMVPVSDLVRARRRLGWLGARQREALEVRRSEESSEEEMEERVARHGGRGQKGGRGRGGPSAARGAGRNSA